MGYLLVTPPQTEPIALEEAKLDARIDADITAEDTFIELLITAVRQYAEQETGRSCITQVWAKVMDCFPGDEGYPWSTNTDAIYLEKGPVQQIDSITYTDLGGVLRTLSWAAPVGSIQRSADGSLVADLSGAVARIAPAFGKQWPIAAPEIGSVSVQFTAGYGDAPEDVPEGLKKWMKLRLGTLNAHREDLAAGNFTLQPLPYIDSLLNAYRIVRA